VVSPDYPHQLPSPAPLEALADLPIITLTLCWPQQLAEEGLRAAGVTPNVVTRLDDYASICALASAKRGVGLVPSLVASYAHDLTIVPLDERMPPRVIGLAWLADRRRIDAVEALIRAARSAASHFDRPALAASSA